VQVYGADSSQLNTNITVSNNYTISNSNTTAYLYPANQEDSLSFGYSGPSITVDGNYLSGGTSNTGGGITFDFGVTGGSITNNIMPQYNGGVAITSGQNVTVSGNKVLSLTGSTNRAGMSTTGNNAPISTITWASSVATVTTASPTGLGRVDGYRNIGQGIPESLFR
jgi:hypothetical protein